MSVPSAHGLLHAVYLESASGRGEKKEFEKQNKKHSLIVSSGVYCRVHRVIAAPGVGDTRCRGERASGRTVLERIGGAYVGGESRVPFQLYENEARGDSRRVRKALACQKVLCHPPPSPELCHSFEKFFIFYFTCLCVHLFLFFYFGGGDGVGVVFLLFH